MKFLNTLITVILSCLVLSNNAFSQAEQVKDGYDGFSFGFSINQFQSDFGIGVRIASPYFGNKVSVSLESSYNFQWLQHVDGSLETVWTSYGTALFGLKFGTEVVNEHFRYYGGAGGVFIVPNENFSSSSSEVGLYGLFGFEFLYSNLGNGTRGYFIEIGGMGTGAEADLVPTDPIYSNGLMLSGGLRFYL